VPELPEVETLRRYLSTAITGRSLVSVDVLDSRIFAAPRALIEADIAGHRIDRVARRGMARSSSCSSRTLAAC
jgi:formamidopyrimidine-DNA glycosylase